MNYINLIPRDIQKLHEPVMLEQHTIIGSNALDDGSIIIIPHCDVISVKRLHDVIEVVANTTEGEQTYTLLDYVVIYGEL